MGGRYRKALLQHYFGSDAPCRLVAVIEDDSDFQTAGRLLRRPEADFNNGLALTGRRTVVGKMAEAWR